MYFFFYKFVEILSSRFTSLYEVLGISCSRNTYINKFVDILYSRVFLLVKVVEIL